VLEGGLGAGCCRCFEPKKDVCSAKLFAAVTRNLLLYLLYGIRTLWKGWLMIAVYAPATDLIIALAITVELD
jgi:hypothetical protein